MSRTRGWTHRVLGALAMAAAMLAGCGRDDRPEVVVYISADQEFAQPIIAEFERQTGIRVVARYDGELTKTVGLANKIRAEANRPVADVFWSGEIFHTILLAREGHLTPAITDVTAAWPEHLRHPDHLWHGFSVRARVIGYNTNRVSVDEAPRRIEDLLDPKWHGRVVIAEPRFGTTGGDVASWFAHYGSQRGEEILRAMAANGIRRVSSNSEAVRQIASGQADICLTDTDDIYVGLRNGWPVAMHFAEQGDNGVLVIPNTVMMIRNGPNPEPARRLVDYLLSEHVARELARSDSRNTPVQPALAEEFPDLAIPKPLTVVTFDQIADQLPLAIERSLEILR